MGATNNEIVSEGHSFHHYVAYIDGLRALAIIPVVIYHLFPSLCPGGFAGVDVFFVISGYLITRGIVNDLRKNEFSIQDFYVRRIKRILPAYFAIIIFVLSFFPFIYSFYRYSSICKTAIYSAVYSANIYFAYVISYFDLEARQNPLLHLWSLGVEEQFYLLVPALVWVLWKIRRRYVLFDFGILFTASFVFSVFSVVRGEQQFAFFMLPSRAWELLAGSIISQIQFKFKPGGRGVSIFGWIGLLLIIFPYVFYNDDTLFPGLAATPSVIGTSLLIVFGGYGAINSILSALPTVAVGKVSYSLYLWHWPIFILFSSQSSLKRALAGVVVVVFATILSYYFVEMPVRKWKAFSARHAFSILVIGSLAIIAFCLIILNKPVVQESLPKYWKENATWVVDELNRDSARSKCNLTDLQNGNKLIKIGRLDGTVNFVLWGDSHALALLPGIDTVADEFGRTGCFINLKHSLTLNNKVGAFPFDPKIDREVVLKWLESRPDIVDVFLVNYWFTHLRNQGDIDEVVYICERLKKSGKNIYFFKNMPITNEEALRRISWGMKVPSYLYTEQSSDYNLRAVRQTQLINVLDQKGLAKILPVEESFFNGFGYTTMTADHTFYFDNSHVNPSGAIHAIRYVAPMIWPSRN